MGVSPMSLREHGRDAHATMNIEIINPATEEVWTEVPAMSVDDVDRAVNAAQKTFEQTWRDMKPGRRAEILFNISRLIRQHLEEIAQIEVKSIGKPINDARDEVALGARIFEYYA